MLRSETQTHLTLLLEDRTLNITRIILAAAMTAGLAVTSLSAAQANVTATIDIVNNTSTTIYHAKDPPSTQKDLFSPGRTWSIAPPDSILAGKDAIVKVTLGPGEFVTFTYGAPNLPAMFLNACTFRVAANAFGNAFLVPNSSRAGSATCGGSLPSGKPYNVQVTIGGF